MGLNFAFDVGIAGLEQVDQFFMLVDNNLKILLRSNFPSEDDVDAACQGLPQADNNLVFRCLAEFMVEGDVELAQFAESDQCEARFMRDTFSRSKSSRRGSRR